MKQAKKFQQRLVLLLLGCYSILLINSLLLFILDANVLFFAYRGTLFFHLILGSILLVPLILFLVPHLTRMPHRANMPAMAAGLFLAITILATSGTGWLLYREDFATQKKEILNIHVVSVVFTLFGFFIHLWLRRKKVFHFYHSPLKATASTKKSQSLFFKTILIGLTVFLVFILAGIPINQKGPILQSENFQPAAAKITSDHYMHSTALDDSKSCGDQGCHPAIFDQWNESAHHFSSFNNPYYQKSIEVMQTDNQLEKIRWCASCHDPMLLLTGEMETVEKDFFVNHPNAKKGITCLSCHAVEGVVDFTGNGNFEISDPGYAAMANTLFYDNPAIRRTVIQTKPEPHGASLLSPVLQTEKFCTSCHKVSIPSTVNDYRWKRGQNHYDDWYESAFSGKNVRAFYTQETQSCISCHMPKVADPLARNPEKMVTSHRFAAANTALPAINNHPDQLKATVDFLQDTIAEVDIFSIRINGRDYLHPTELPTLRAGDQLEIAVVVHNKNTGHQLPSGTNDSNEWWLSVELQDEDGQVVLSSGSINQEQVVDSTAHFFKAVLIDKKGALIDKRNVHQWYATIYNSAIPAGKSQLVRYRASALPANISEIKIDFRQRKFNQYYNQLTFAGEPENHISEDEIHAIQRWVFNDHTVPRIPVTSVATTRLRNKIVANSAQPIWRRWNNYGISLLQEENYNQAIKAFKQVAMLQPHRADGWLNQSRALLAEGSLEAAESILADLQDRFPESKRIAYFLGEIYFSQGRFDLALDQWNSVITAYPDDPLLLSNLGQIYYLMNDYEQSAAFLKRAQAINPESAMVSYRLMLLYSATGDADEAKKFQEQYQKYKNNKEEAVAVAGFKKKHATINNEVQVVHYHGLHRTR